LDTDPEQAFDDLTLMASPICGAPIALISLVDEDRQWFKSRVGLRVHNPTRKGASSQTFCDINDSLFMGSGSLVVRLK
jgi:hypothetical protein